METLELLRNEIDNTLYFFIKADLEMYGYISKGTVEAFSGQGFKFPVQLKSLVEL